MKTFRLDAVEDGRLSIHWDCSSLPPGAVWVSASNEEEAREKVTAATAQARRGRLGDDSPLPPWKQSELVTCTPDDTRSVPEDVVITANGTMLELPA
jgi:hypothetical protein